LNFAVRDAEYLCVQQVKPPVSLQYIYCCTTFVMQVLISFHSTTHVQWGLYV